MSCLDSRAAGVLLHVTSLPGPGGVGDLGPAAHAFAAQLREMGASLWQMLPVGPTGYGHSPYQALSSFAGNESLISLEDLRGRGWLAAEDLLDLPAGAEVDFAATVPAKRERLLRAHRVFSADRNARADFSRFRETEAAWLPDYARFRARKDHCRGSAWPDWPAEVRSRAPEDLAKLDRELAEEIEHYEFLQYVFHLQWTELRAAATAAGVWLVGDLPIFVAHDSADVWAVPELFRLDERGWPTVVAGVPPDYFSADGQRWGNPLYDWGRHEAEDFRWWATRLAGELKRFDAVRIDHFRGFEAYWEIPADEETAVNGRWVKGPGEGLFRALRRRLGRDLPVVAEDLGMITEEVHALREALALPGMRVLQFCFGDRGAPPESLPRGWSIDSVAYTGTHDNETLRGWLERAPDETNTLRQEDIDRQIEHAQEYAGVERDGLHWALVRLVLRSPSRWAVVPLQDLLELGADARMNTPGTVEGNWKWRATEFPIPRESILKFATMVAESDRSPA